MGILHEVLIVIGVALTLLIVWSVGVLGREFFETGHVSLAILDDHRACVGASCAGMRQPSTSETRRF